MINLKSALKALFTGLLLIYAPYLSGQDLADVKININMSLQAAMGNFSPEKEFIDIAGTFNEWGATVIKASDPDGDLIYSLTLSDLQVGTTILYKIRFNGKWDGREEFPGAGNDRKYTVLKGENTINIWFYNMEPSVPEANIYTSNLKIVKGQTIKFEDKSTGYPVKWEWIFEGGNPTTSTERNPLVTYEKAGVYGVSLKVSNVKGSNSTNKAGYIEVTDEKIEVEVNVNMSFYIKTGKFNINKDSVGIIGDFSNSKNDILLTDKDGDGIYTGIISELSPYQNISYSFRLNHNKDKGETMNRHYVVQPSCNLLNHWFNDEKTTYPYAGFFASTTKAIIGEVVRFYENSEGGLASGWSWTFEGGDPSTSTIQNPLVSYSNPGVYEVSLTVKNAAGESNLIKNDFITVTSVDEALDWWNAQVFYQVYPRSFKDSNNDGKGDLQGIISKLDYLNDADASTTNDLGVTALYIMPVHECTNPNYGGYEVTDYKSISQECGTQADFDQLVAEAHKRGMKVIMDMVFNHTSYQHPWFIEASKGIGSKFEDFYVWNKDNLGWCWRTNNTNHTNANVNNFWGKFGDNTPDLNFGNLSVKNAVKDISKYWLAKNIDGFRLDAPMFLYEKDKGIGLDKQQNLPETYSFFRDWRNLIKAENPTSFSVGETWLLNDMPAAGKYVYQGFDIGFQFDIAYGIEDALNKEARSYIQSPVTKAMDYYPYLQFGVFASNHDLYNRAKATSNNDYNPLRIKDRLNNNKDAKAKIAAAIVLTSPGVPFLYYGDETGASGGYARKPMQWDNTGNSGFSTATPWSSVGTDYPTYNVKSEENDPNSILNLYKQLISLRLGQNALKKGNYKAFDSDFSAIYSYIRSYKDEKMLVLINLSSKDQENVELNLENSGLENGTYALNSLMGTLNPNKIQVDNTGNINKWTPNTKIEALSINIFKLSKTTGIVQKNNPMKENLKIIVNQDNNSLHLKISGLKANNHFNIQLCDLSGREIRSINETGGSNGSFTREISVKNYDSGVYIINIRTSDIFKSQKFYLQ